MQAAAVSPMSRADSSLRTTHLLLAVQSIIIVLLSVNRLSALTLAYVLPNEFLRWVDLNNMLVLPLVSVLAFYLLKRQLPYAGPAYNSARHRALDLAFVAAVYVLGAGYGDHEVTNYLNGRFCAGDSSALCRIIAFNDDVFSHLVFFAGFVLINASLLLIESIFPYRGVIGARDAGLLAANGLIIGLGIFANLAFEQIGLDLYVVALLLLIALALLIRRGAQPLAIYYSIAYSFGLIGTALYKIFV
jgi:hypothetical protein